MEELKQNINFEILNETKINDKVKLECRMSDDVYEIIALTALKNGTSFDEAFEYILNNYINEQTLEKEITI